MEALLTQEEVDALLKGIVGREIPTETVKEEVISDTRPYDLTSQDRMIRGRMPNLEVIFDRFSRLLRVTLSAFLRRVVDINPVFIEMLKFSDFLNDLSIPSILHIFHLRPLRGAALMVLESKLIFPIIEYFLGGKGVSSIISEGREYTEIEQKIIEKVAKAALKDLETAWRPVHPVDIQWEGAEINPQFITIASPNDAVISAPFEIGLGNTHGIMTLCIPYSTIEPIRKVLQTGFERSHLEVDQGWIDRLKEILMEVELNLSVELGKAELALKDLVGLAPGDIIQLDKDVDEELTIRVDEVPKFRGFPGILKGNKAVQISSVIIIKERPK